MVTPNKELIVDFIKRKIDSTAKMSDFEDVEALTISTNPGLIWLSRASIPEDIPLINHELFHATVGVMNYAGVILNDSSDEAFAYEFQYLSNQLYKQLQ